MKLITLLLLLASAGCAFGQTDENVIAVGEWSKPVTDRDHTLRGRLLVYDDRVPSAANHARVYLELQHVFKGGWSNAIEINYDIGGEDPALHLELRDRQGRVVPQANYSDRGRVPDSWLVTLLCDSTVRLRADSYTSGLVPKPAGLTILVEDGCWVIPPRHPPVFLSGSFTPTKILPGPLDYFVWQGTLALPKVKILVR